MERIHYLEKRDDARSQVVALGTLACPECDAPVAPGPKPLLPAEPLSCPVCAHGGAVRDFLSLRSPTRPAHVRVTIGARRGSPVGGPG
jgi:hypothetical protein